MGSALIVFVSSLDGGGIQQAIAGERKSRTREGFDRAGRRSAADCVTLAQKEQGRWRSMTPGGLAMYRTFKLACAVR